MLAQPVEMGTARSPDNNVAVHLWWDSSSGQIDYSITHGTTTILNISRLGLAFRGRDLGSGFDKPKVQVKDISSESMTFRSGKRLRETYRYRTLVADCANSSTHTFQIEFRVSDDGVAFRYVILGTGTAFLKYEYTSYQLPRKSDGYIAGYLRSRRDKLGNYEDDAETRYRDTLVPGIPDEIGFPALFAINQEKWLLLSESGNDVGFPDGHLFKDSHAACKYHQWFRDLGTWLIPLPLPFKTPWRVAIIGNLRTIFESDLIRELGNAVQGGIDFGFIRTGFAATSAYAANDNYNRAAVQAAASLRFSWVSFDATWDQDGCITRHGRCNAPGAQSPVTYAHAQGLRVMLWINAADIYPKSTPRAVLSKLHSYGADGAKVDFMQGYRGSSVPESPPKMYRNLGKYAAVAQAAADQRMCILFHGDSVPRGLERRFPNVLGYEGVRNSEHFYDRSQTPTADQNNIITYTRNVIGPMDFMIDPKISARVTQDAPTTTKGHTIAEAIVFSSGLSTLWGGNADYVADSMPNTAELFRSLPSHWDDLRWLRGQPAASTMVARRSGDSWFVGLITANPATTTVQVKLDFIGSGSIYDAFVYTDAPVGCTDECIVKSTLRNVSKASTLSNIHVQPHGGFVIRLDPKHQSQWAL